MPAVTDEGPEITPVKDAGKPSAEDKKIADLEAKLEKAQADNKALRKKNAELTEELEAAGEAAALLAATNLSTCPEGDHAVFKGVAYPIVGDYRADNTFHHVKTRDCDEGLCLLAIPRPH